MLQPFQIKKFGVGVSEKPARGNGKIQVLDYRNHYCFVTKE